MMVALGRHDRKRVGTGGLLLLGILLTGWATAEAQALPAVPVAIEPPRALMEAKFQTLDGGRKRLVDFRGEVLVVNLWATWCGPCRKEIPYLNELNTTLGPQGVRIIGLTTERPEEDRPRVTAFADSLEIGYLVGFARGELMRYLMQGRNAIPQTYVFDRKGRLLRHFIGFNPRTSPLHLRTVIDQALVAAE